MSPAEIKSRAPAVIGPRKSESDENGKEEQRWTSGLPSTKPTISPWLLEPSSKLLGFTSTKELPKHADIVVVGSGITGAFAAHFLKEGWAKDLSVVMLDAREACWGSSGQNIGAVEMLLFQNSWDVSAMTLESVQLLRDFVRDNDIPCEWQDCLGVFAVPQPMIGFGIASVADMKAAMPESMGKVLDSVAWGPSASSSSSRTRDDGEPVTAGDGGWDVDKIRATLAGLGVHDADGVVLQANSATVHPYRLVAWILERLLERHGADGFALHTHTPVTRLSRRGGGAPAAAGGYGGGNWTLATPRGDVSAERVLLATNGYTSALLPEFEELIVPVRCQAAAAPATSSPEKPPLDLESRMYTFLCGDGKREERLLQTGGAGGQLIVAGGKHVAADFGVGVWRDDVTEPRVERYLEGMLEGFLGGEERNGGDGRAETFEVRHWAGIEGYARDYNPWVGAVPEARGGGPGLFLCAGYALNGLSMAPMCAKRVVQEMATTPTRTTTAGSDRDHVDVDRNDEPLGARDAARDKIDLFPSKLMSTAERIEIAMEDWPDVQTMEEEGVETYIKAGVGQMIKGRNPVPTDSKLPSGSRRFEAGAMGRKW
ncbi:hypothetical protein M0657_004582 [Pyricularia oryzae]|nr:hypothetical protein OOU_Y34scaffold00153g20 [Pyricularia oryzae Y34]KAI7919481.1 hypothetical protein M9X92_006362 [Pyricularia oryzae]KAI7924538.1 hypothetical protein M0657_004582 [Pyricularia oryzae]